MRTIVAGILAMAVYAFAIGILVSMAMPTHARVQAYIDASRPVAISAAPVQTIDVRLAG